MRHKITLLILLVFPLAGFSQLNDTSINMFQANVNYSMHLPGGDLAETFGMSHTVGLSVDFKHKSNWNFGLEYAYLFGGMIKDSTILDHLKNSDGDIINEYGERGTILITERGFYAGAHVGRLIPVLGPNPNSGIKVQVGAGLLEHHIHIENRNNNVPAVLGDYKKGYDHRTNGFTLKEFIGYQFLDPNGYFNFYAGFEFYQAWTYNRREMNFDTGMKDTELKQDYLSGFRVGWILPLYQKDPEDFYYY